MVDLTASQKKQLATYKDRLARVKRGEVGASDHPGPDTPEEKTAEIARLKARQLEAPLPRASRTYLKIADCCRSDNNVE